MGTNWKVKGVDQELRDDIATKLKLSPLVATLLINRGVKDVEAARSFVRPNLTDLRDPFLLRDCEKAVGRILAAITEDEKIVVYGDEDVDGITSTILMFETLRDVGGQVDYYIPSRVNEGVGLNKTFIENASKQGAKVIITVDCGITNHREVTYAKRRGIDVIITDHHEPLGRLPQALAVINPKRKNCNYPFKGLAGSGVAYKVAQALAMKKLGITASQWQSVKGELLALVLLGTIADRMELLDENRLTATFGLKVLQRLKKPWAKAIAKVTATELHNLSLPSLLTLFVPVLSSAASDNGDNAACELLLTNDRELAGKLASQLFRTSQYWHDKAREAYTIMRRKASRLSSGNIITLIEDQFGLDFLGYCASRLKDDFSRPVVIIAIREDKAIGEARAPHGFDLIDCLKSCNDLLLDYGGHKRAAGFSVEPERVNQLRTRLEIYAEETLNRQQQPPELEIEAEFRLWDLSPQIIKEIRLLAPFGEGNPEPLLLDRNVYIKKVESAQPGPERPGDEYHVLGKELVLVTDKWHRLRWPYLKDEPARVDVIYSVDETGAVILKDYLPSGV